jgi:hypothetical protein
MRKTFVKTQFGMTFDAEAESADGRVWRWTSNGAVCPLDACKEYGIPCDPVAQATAIDEEVEQFLGEYRRMMAGRGPSEEERFEMRAAFGRGVEVVDVITGRRTRT